MLKPFVLGSLCLATAAAWVVGCKPKPTVGPASPPAAPAPTDTFFRTPFKNESQFIVEKVLSDLAEQLLYAASHRLPDSNTVSVMATEKAGSPVDAPVYEVAIRLRPQQPPLAFELNLTGPIWSPEVYQDAAGKLAGAAGLNLPQTGGAPAELLAPKLCDNSPETLEQQNLQLSTALEKDFLNPGLHEQAALLLGAFLLRDHSGDFFEIRSPLSLLSAHLTLARCLRRDAPYSLDGQLAEAVLLTLIGNTGPAVARLDAVGTNTPAVLPFVRALRACATGDYRPIDQLEAPSPLESFQSYAARSDYAGAVMAWEKLTTEQKQSIAYVRRANEMPYSVGMGHELLLLSIPLELQECASIYELARNQTLEDDALPAALNELPDGCFRQDTNGQAHVQVIGWGQWANFLQRHLCQAMEQNYLFLAKRWGVPEEAAKFSAQCDQKFGALRLYPLVRRFQCSTVESYHRAEDEGFKLIRTTPQWVPIACWNLLCYKVRFASFYCPVPNPHINEWHNHNPPPGTLYDFGPRLDHPSLVGRPDAVAKFDQLHLLAPYNCRIAAILCEKKYKDRPTYQQAMDLYAPALGYCPSALSSVAYTVRDQPRQYEKLLLQAAELNPTFYYDLASYAQDRRQDDQAAGYLEKACNADPDAVQVASHAEWRVGYYLKKGQTAKARTIADAAAEVYSEAGLSAKAYFLEATTNYPGAVECLTQIEERYNHSMPLLSFYLRYKAQTGDSRYDAEIEQRVRKLFPRGLEKVSVGDLHGSPKDGVLIKEENALLKAAGLKAGDIIVAAYGTRVHNMLQYVYCRDSHADPGLTLLVWQNHAYREVKASPPGHRFGVEFIDYVPPKPAHPTPAS